MVSFYLLMVFWWKGAITSFILVAQAGGLQAEEIGVGMLSSDSISK